MVAAFEAPVYWCTWRAAWLFVHWDGVRYFHIDIDGCGVCGGTFRVVARIETSEVIERILQ